MGVTGLWDILWNLSESKPLKYLSGKRVAVDLSGWIVQATQCKGLNTSKNPHLRNLFFRVSRLLQDGALPIFVMEGDIPSLKINSFKKRNEQHAFHNTNNDNIKRSSFDRLHLQCKELLESLGVPCIKSSGEAEAFCAFLCSNGIVEGVITEDNDAFLYGADSIYRDFTIDPSDSHVKLYNLKSEKNKLHLDRTKLIAIALLLGCDYVKGVPGIGKDTVLKLFEELPDCDLLQRFKDWKEKEESELFPGYQPHVKKLSHCTRCNHLGSQTKHRTNGCEMCDSKITCYLSGESKPCLCDWHKSNEISLKRKTELKVYNAIKKIPDFPNLEVIQEYLSFSDTIPEENMLEWKCPDWIDFQNKAFNFWNWTMDNSSEKIFPIITSWHQFKTSDKVNLVDESNLLIKPVKILRQRVVKGEDCVLVQWEPLADIDYLSNIEDLCSTEYEDRFSKAYPNISKIFFDSITVDKSKPQVKSKKKSSKLNEHCKKVISQPPVKSSVSNEIFAIPSSNTDEYPKILQCSFSELPLSERIKIISNFESKMNYTHFNSNTKENFPPKSCKSDVQDLQKEFKNCFISNAFVSNEIMKSNISNNQSLFCSDNQCLIFEDSGNSSFEILTPKEDRQLQLEHFSPRPNNSLKKIFDSFCNLTPVLHQEIFKSSHPIPTSDPSLIFRNSLCLEFTDSDNSFIDVLNSKTTPTKPIYICNSKSNVLKNVSRFSNLDVNKTPMKSITSDIQKSTRSFNLSENNSPNTKSFNFELQTDIPPISSTPYKTIMDSNLPQHSSVIFTPLVFDSSTEDSVICLN